MRIPSRSLGQERLIAGALRTLGACAAVGLASAGPVLAQAPAPQERVAAIKESLAESQVKLRSYEWIETTLVSLEGEERSRMPYSGRS